MSERREAGTPSVSVVVVNWNGKNVLPQCLDSILALEYPIKETIVVDNGSVDGSGALLRERYGERVTVIWNERNLGAPVARNQGMRHAVESGSDFVFTLDNDLTIAPDAIAPLVRLMQGDPKIAMAGALILHQDRPDVIFSAGHMVNWTQNLVRTLGANQRLQGQFREIWDVDYVGSGAMLTRRSYIEQHGYFDETLIGYGYEDTEYGYRAKQLGFRVVCCADARVWHRPHSGIGRYSYRKKYLEARNAVVFMKRHGNLFRWSKYLFYVLLGFGYAAVREGLRGNFAGVRGKMRGFIDGLRGREDLAYRLLDPSEPA
ncbi:MAG TPA: glycosyltransferase family 2 protein [Longimicrobiales bacterium]